MFTLILLMKKKKNYMIIFGILFKLRLFFKDVVTIKLIKQK